MLISRHGNTKKEIKDGIEKSTYILEQIQIRHRAHSMERKKQRQNTLSPEVPTLSNEKKKAKTGGHSQVSLVASPYAGPNMGTPIMDQTLHIESRRGVIPKTRPTSASTRARTGRLNTPSTNSQNGNWAKWTSQSRAVRKGDYRRVG